VTEGAHEPRPSMESEKQARQSKPQDQKPDVGRGRS